MTDSIADFLIRIQNALMASHEEVSIPYSKMKKSMAEILEKEGYVKSVEVDESGSYPRLNIKLRYVGKVPAVSGVRRLSKPGRRLYTSVDKIPRALGGYGITILSTNRGVLTDKEARKKNVGGELICQVW